MNIGVLGLNHRTAPVELRERVAFSGARIPEALRRVREELEVPECVILSTCNRVEMYAAFARNGAKPPTQADRLERFLAQFHQLEPDFLSGRLYWRTQPDSVRHLFHVSSGLDSMVLGESEILGQVKEAYSQAVSCGTVGSLFHRLFQTAIRTGKEVRTKTRIGQGAVSISSVAVELARKIFQSLATKAVLTIGAGQMGEATLTSLKNQGVKSILLANRSFEAALKMAEAFDGEPVRMEQLEAGLARADIVISSTSADRYLLTADPIRRVMVSRRQRPLFLIDISVPRNLDPEIGRLENVYLYDIDDLEGIASANRLRRQDEMVSCMEIIETGLGQFLSRFERE